VTTENAISIRPLTPPEVYERISALTDILIDCVEGGAFVSFMAPLSTEKAQAFWRGVAERIAGGKLALLIAEDTATNRVIGTVQIVLDHPENQPHRADISKMLVHSNARKRGVGTALMRAAEDNARATGKTLLLLDTATGGDAARLYEHLGWTTAGVVPGYAMSSEGCACSGTLYYKQL
jgi:GNAT superfamily N-acetyltransferase